MLGRRESIMFVDLSGLIANNPPGLHYGVAVADLDGDGRLEFVVAGFGGPNRVLRWSSGGLRDVASPQLADPERQAVGLAAGDIDGDGREELYVLNTDAFSGPKRFSDCLFDVHPDGRWEDLFTRPDNAHIRNLAAGRSVAVIDRRGVGRYGFFVANYDRPMRLYEVNPDGSLADLAPPLGLARTAGGRGVLSLPVFGFHPDIICVNERGPNFVFHNRGDGTFTECAAATGLDDPHEHARGIAAFDAGASGEFGLCWGNWEGPHRLMIRRDDGTWKDHATAGLAFPSAVRTMIAADFDNDGHDELFFNNVGEANRLFRVQASQEARRREAGELKTRRCLCAASSIQSPASRHLHARSRRGTGRRWLRHRARRSAISMATASWNCSSPAANAGRNLLAFTSRGKPRAITGSACGRSRGSEHRPAVLWFVPRQVDGSV